MKLPVKWKVFRFANYFMAFVFLFFLSFLIYTITKEGVRKEELPWIETAITGIALIILNSAFNLFLSYKYFPDKVLHGKIKVIYIISVVLYSVALLGLLCLTLFGLNEELKEPTEDNTGIIAVILLFFFLVIGCYILIMQLLIRKFLQLNFKKTISDLIEGIGEDQEKSNLRIQ